MNKEAIDTIVWWIPFRKTRDAVRDVLNNLLTRDDIKELRNFLIYESIPMSSTDNERELFHKHIESSKKYLEFGCGGSTFLVLSMSDVDVISVESDKNFMNYISKFGIIKNLENKSRFKFFHVDIGEIRGWGWPVDDSKYKDYPNYSQSIFNVLDKNVIESIDTVFVDGRFRVACVLSTLLNCSSNTKIIIHDFFNREYYHVVLDFIEEVDRADTLGVFKIKENVNYDTVKVLLEKYQYITN